MATSYWFHTQSWELYLLREISHQRMSQFYLLYPPSKLFVHPGLFIFGFWKMGLDWFCLFFQEVYISEDTKVSHFPLILKRNREKDGFLIAFYVNFLWFSPLIKEMLVFMSGFRWSARAIRSFGLGELEARKLKYPNTGTDALLMGILIEGWWLFMHF